MIGVVSPSVIAFSSLDLFLLRIIRVMDSSVAKQFVLVSRLTARLYLCLNSADLPVSFTPLVSLQHSLFQLYFAFPQESLASQDPRSREKAHQRVVSCPWSATQRIALDYSQLVTSATPLFPYHTSLSTLLLSLDDFLFVLIGSHSLLASHHRRRHRRQARRHRILAARLRGGVFVILASL